MKTYILYILLFACLISCTEKKKFVIAVSQCSEDIWREKLNDELLTGAMLHDNVELRLASANDDDRRQIEQIDRFVDEDVDLLIVSPNQMNTVTCAIDRAYDHGIPVILFDRKTDSPKYTAFIGADNVEIGRLMGQYAVSKLGGHGTVAEITGLDGSSPAIERHRGFSEAIASSQGIRLVACKSGDWTKRSGRDVMDSIMATGTDINLVFAHNDRMALGAYEVAKAAGKAGGMSFVGIDALSAPDGGIRMVRNGVLDASYIYPTRGDLVMQLAMNILEGRPYKKDNYMKAAIVTGENAGVMMMQAEEMDSQRTQLKILHDEVDMYLTRYSHQQIYLFLCILVLLFGGVAFAMFYRTLLIKRRMTEQAANARLEFFTNVSHELRTPLTLIADPVEQVMCGDNLTRRQRDMLSVVRSNVSVMLRLVGEIMDFRKIQSGKMSLNVTRFSLTSGMRRWADCFVPIAEKKNINLVCRTDSEINVTADIYKVERICYNLLANAMKYTPSGGSVTLSACVEGDSVRINVADTGVGIPREQVKNVFERFYQAGNAVSGGTGIGLAIVKAFAEMHGGSVSASSTEGQGSLFTVVLPLDCGQTPKTDRTEELIPHDSVAESGLTMVENPSDANADRITSADGERPTVLVVDDNGDVRAYIASLLAPSFVVITATDGREGLDMAVREVPDIIICDVMMPVMDGLEMCRRIKSETATSHIPVILLTARTFENQRAEGYDCGADAYITKPFNGNTLLSRLHNLLENRRMLRRLFAGTGSCVESSDDADSRFIASFRDIIHKKMHDSDLSVEDLSAELGLSRVQMYRKVKALTGSTPVELIRQARLKRAEQILKSCRGKSVSEVAYTVGFSSPSYFAKCFKDHFGISPTELD